MPRISYFFGIVITMYWREHPVPHFHASYGGQAASIALDGPILGGLLSLRALGLVQEWTLLHQEELLANWHRACDRQPLEWIVDEVLPLVYVTEVEVLAAESLSGYVTSLSLPR